MVKPQIWVDFYSNAAEINTIFKGQLCPLHPVAASIPKYELLHFSDKGYLFQAII